MFLTSEWIALHNHLENGFICLKIAKGKFWPPVQEKNRSEFVQFHVFNNCKAKKNLPFPVSKKFKSGAKNNSVANLHFGNFPIFSGRPGENPKRMMKIGPDRIAWSQRANRPLTWPQETWRCSTDQLRMGFQGGSWRWHGSKGKVGYPWESTRDIYQHIPPIYGLYNGCIGQYGVILGEQLLGYTPKGTQHFPLNGRL